MSPRAMFTRAVPFAFVGAAAAASIIMPSKRDAVAAPIPSSVVMNFTNVVDPFSFDVVNQFGDNQVVYTANITVDGVSYEVQLDTGSSDFWLNTQNNTLSSQANDTKINVAIVYGDTTAAIGDVFIAEAVFGNFSIPQQAFINAPGSNASSDNDLGLIGLSSANISRVYGNLTGTPYNGNPVLYNVFAAYPNVSQFMTFQLARSNLGITDGGVFTIGEVDLTYAAVLNQTQMPVVAQEDQWVVYTDGVIVDGKNYTGHGALSKIKDAPKDLKEKTLSLLDTGTSLGVLSPYYWDAIYKDIPGIVTLDKDANLYAFPCNSKRNVSVVLNGTEYPIHPLDITRVATVANQTVCVNAFNSAELPAEAGVDFILGDAFLRNTYTLMNFGNWTNATAPAPYVQVLSTTIQSAAWAEFDQLNQARIDQWNQLGGQYNGTNNSPSTVATKRSVRK